MRGLPPPPDDVLRLRCVYDVDLTPASVAWWLFVPGAQSMSAGELEALAGDFLVWYLPFSTAVTHRGCSLARVDLSRFGNGALTLSVRPSSNHGTFTGGQLAVGCTCFHLVTDDAAHSRAAVVHMPAVPDSFSDDHQTLNGPSFDWCRLKAVSFLNGIDSVVPVGGSSVVLGTVHRSGDGRPLAAATFSPALAIRPANVIGTLDRRRTLGR